MAAIARTASETVQSSVLSNISAIMGVMSAKIVWSNSRGASERHLLVKTNRAIPWDSMYVITAGTKGRLLGIGAGRSVGPMGAGTVLALRAATCFGELRCLDTEVGRRSTRRISEEQTRHLRRLMEKVTCLHSYGQEPFECVMSGSRKSMADLLDMPLDSSPLKAPSPRVTTPPDDMPPLRPESPSPPQVSILQRKRPAEDLTQYAGEVARANKLKKEDHNALASFSKLGRGEQMVYIAGHLLALGHQQKLIQPAPADWKVPKSLLACVNCFFHDVHPNKLLTDLVLANPSWGFPPEMKDETHAVDALGTAISGVLISKRNIVKTAVLGSLGSDPDEDATSPLRPGALNIVDLSAVVLEKLKVKSVKVDVRMCGRIAILRKMISEKNNNTRDEHPDPTKQSKFIKKFILDPDLEMYGAVDLNSLATPAAPGPIAGPSTTPQMAGDASDNDDEHDHPGLPSHQDAKYIV
ncbi:hypothetical protein B0H13DRAFT_1884078 [Mycena leptocephala]|nr:hypothetical protein B0H13DRAFT_1884078 [Mycena leptocephala]